MTQRQKRELGCEEGEGEEYVSMSQGSSTEGPGSLGGSQSYPPNYFFVIGRIQLKQGRKIQCELSSAFIPVVPKLFSP